MCASGCDFTTVQEAVDLAGDGAVIELRDAVHTEAGIVVRSAVTLRGLGPNVSILQGHQALSQAPERVLLVEEGASLTLEKLTIRHGRPSTQEVGGGGVMNLGTLTVKDCIISDNSGNDGAGIYSRGDLTVINTTVRDNLGDGLAPSGFECGSGGGIKATKGTLTLINSTVSGNRAGTEDRGKGGGVFVGCDCTAEIINTTISGNKSTVDGGGISIRGQAHLVHCTVSNNITSGEGAGVFVRGHLDMENSIVAGNWGDAECVLGGPGDYRGKGELGTRRGNLVKDGSCDAPFTGDARLSRLADNGGSTMTHSLLPESPAVDALSLAECLDAQDQRGARRPASQINPDSPCDIGAFELQPQWSAADCLERPTQSEKGTFRETSMAVHLDDLACTGPVRVRRHGSTLAACAYIQRAIAHADETPPHCDARPHLRASASHCHRNPRGRREFSGDDRFLLGPRRQFRDLRHERGRRRSATTDKPSL